MNELQFNIKDLKEDRETKEWGGGVGREKGQSPLVVFPLPQGVRFTSLPETALKMPAFKCL